MGVMESTNPDTTFAPLPVRISMLSPTTKGLEMYCQCHRFSRPWSSQEIDNMQYWSMQARQDVATVHRTRFSPEMMLPSRACIGTVTLAFHNTSHACRHHTRGRRQAGTEPCRNRDVAQAPHLG